MRRAAGGTERIRSAVGRMRAFVRRFADARRGNVAMIFGLTLPVLVMITLGGVDINRASTVKSNLQDALDAATLAAARSSYVTDADLTRVGTAALRANLQPFPDITLSNAKFTLSADQVVIADATVGVKTLVANIVLPPYGKVLNDTVPVGAHSEVNRSSKNIEVALVLDITGSMAGNKIIDLKSAANDLIDIVVQDVQTPYYTKLAIVPYSIGVNVGSYADAARGTMTQSKTITDIEWQANGLSRNLSSISRASPGVFTTGDPNGHGLQTGDYVWISGVVGMTQVNDYAYRVVKISGQTFSLQYKYNGTWYNLNTTSGNGFSSYSSGGRVRKCLVEDCHLVVTASSHGIPATTTDQGSTKPGTVYLTGINGLSALNNRGYEVGDVTTNTYSISVTGPEYPDYTSGGSSWCGQDGCQWRVFRNMNGGIEAFQASTCVSERVGGQAYTSASPSGAPVGRNYPAVNNASTPNPCPAAVIQPLSTSKTALKSLVNGLTVTGSTAGHIGLAWGWYTVSPSFNSLWSGNGAGPNVPKDTMKAVILMTDGAFNTPYCTGVIASDAGSGSGSSNDHIGCEATNGDPFSQARALCSAMKAQEIIVYTVGFEVGDEEGAASVLADCASGPDYAYLPDTGEDLSEAFAAIGRDITQLRISK